MRVLTTHRDPDSTTLIPSSFSRAYFWRALTFGNALTFGQTVVAIKNYAYFRIMLTFGLRLLPELYGTLVYPAFHSYSKSDPHSVKKYVSSISYSEKLISVACAAIFENSYCQCDVTFSRKYFLQWRPVSLFRRWKTRKIFSIFLQFLGILGKCYVQYSCLYLLDGK